MIRRKGLELAKREALGWGAAWKDIAPPSGWSWTLPFTIQQRRRSFRPPPGWNLAAHAGITVAKEYYVDKSTGNNANNGLSWNTAFKDLKTAYARPDVDRVLVRNSYFFYSEQSPVTARSVEVIGEGDNVWITNDVRNDILDAWTLDGGCYKSRVGAYRYVNAMRDLTRLDAHGNPLGMARMTSKTGVDATPHSFWVDYPGTGGVSFIYVRSFDGRAPDDNLQYLEGVAQSSDFNNRRVYYRNVNLLGGTWFRNATSTGGHRVYLEQCRFHGGITLAGIDEFIARNCSGWSSGDVINYNARNGRITKAIEIDCELGRVLGGSTDQASTTHNGCEIVRINGRYGNVSGQCIADVGGGKTWCLGVQVHGSQSGIGFHSAVSMWLDHCRSFNNRNFDLQNVSGTTLRVRQFFGERGANDISGTLETY